MEGINPISGKEWIVNALLRTTCTLSGNNDLTRSENDPKRNKKIYRNNLIHNYRFRRYYLR